MPVAAARTLSFSAEEYLDWEASQDERHEFHAGEVFPTPGGSAAHAELIVALGALLFVALRETEFRVRSEALRVQVDDHTFVYPDLSVTRGSGTYRSASRTSLLNPVLVAEVLSPSTRAYDLGEKFQLYRSMPSVREVLFVDSERRFVEVARLGDEGWTLSGPVVEGAVALRSLGVEVAVDELYRGVELG